MASEQLTVNPRGARLSIQSMPLPMLPPPERELPSELEPPPMPLPPELEPLPTLRFPSGRKPPVLLRAEPPPPEPGRVPALAP